MSSGMKIFLAVFGVVVFGLVMYYTTTGEDPADPPVVRSAADPLVVPDPADRAGSRGKPTLVTERSGAADTRAANRGAARQGTAGRAGTGSTGSADRGGAAPSRTAGGTPATTPRSTLADLPGLGTSPALQQARAEAAAARKALQAALDAKSAQDAADADPPKSEQTAPETERGIRGIPTMNVSRLKMGSPLPTPPPAGPSTTPPARSQRPERPAFTDHFVQPGETLSSIAQTWFGDAARWELIAEANPMIDPHRLRPGDLLRLPAPSSIVRERAAPAEPSAGGGRTHTVASGESLSSIADRYYGDESAWQKIHDANRGTIGADPHRLAVGMKLRIP